MRKLAAFAFGGLALLGLAASGAAWIASFICATVELSEIGWVFLLGLATAARVFVLIGRKRITRQRASIGRPIAGCRH